MAETRVQVLVAGGGAVGLSMSIFLSDKGIDHLVVERHEGTSILPKAHSLNQRFMEIMRQHGVADLTCYTPMVPYRIT
jgi:2,4-dichlorophenol 6-monooxygenase